MTKIERDDVRDLFAAEIRDSEIVEACIVCISIGVRRSSYPSFIWDILYLMRLLTCFS